jgi:hypothetical protein
LTPQQLLDEIRTGVQPILAGQQQLQTILEAAQAIENLAQAMIQYGTPNNMVTGLWSALASVHGDANSAINYFVNPPPPGP